MRWRAVGLVSSPTEVEIATLRVWCQGPSRCLLPTFFRVSLVSAPSSREEDMTIESQTGDLNYIRSKEINEALVDRTADTCWFVNE